MRTSAAAVVAGRQPTEYPPPVAARPVRRVCSPPPMRAGPPSPCAPMFKVDAGGIRHVGRDPGPGALRARALTDGSRALESGISVGSLTQPTCMAFLDVNDILVGQKIDGQVRRIQDETMTGPVLDLDVSAIGEQGLDQESRRRVVT